MTLHNDTRQQIEEILKQSFSPIELAVIDDSHAHRNHLAALEHPSAGHFKVVMKSAMFNGKAMVARHRMVYEQLSSLMDTKIHAISLDLNASNE